jgi:hypothetical protein
MGQVVKCREIHLGQLEQWSQRDQALQFLVLALFYLLGGYLPFFALKLLIGRDLAQIVTLALIMP